MFISSAVRPSNLIQVFAFADDYSFAILQSHLHWLWFITKCGKRKSDFRYSAESVFDTFPWPQSPTAKQVEAVAQAGRQVRHVRTNALAEMQGGLRAPYRTLELPGANPLKDAHAALDAAVLAAYGFSAKKDLLAQLLELNLAVAQRLDNGLSGFGGEGPAAGCCGCNRLATPSQECSTGEQGPTGRPLHAMPKGSSTG
jgi:hypothetical protein